MEHPYQQAIRSLTNRLHLRPVSPFSQSWEVEVADANALPAFQAAYESGDLPEMEKKVLMRVILESLEKAAKKPIALPEGLLQRIASLIQVDYQLHRDSLLPWALLDERRDGEEHIYRITPFVREIMLGNDR